MYNNTANARGARKNQTDKLSIKYTYKLKYATKIDIFGVKRCDGNLKN